MLQNPKRQLFKKLSAFSKNNKQAAESHENGLSLSRLVTEGDCLDGNSNRADCQPTE
jgi:hypothetical protein